MVPVEFRTDYFPSPLDGGTFDFDQLPFFAGFFCFQENLIVQQEFRPSGVVLVLASDKNIQHRCLTRKKWSHVFDMYLG